MFTYLQAKHLFKTTNQRTPLENKVGWGMKADRVNHAHRRWLTWNQFIILAVGKRLIIVWAQVQPEVNVSLQERICDSAAQHLFFKTNKQL